MLKKSKLIAVLSVCVMMFSVVQPAFASVEDAAGVGVAGAILGGIVGGVVGFFVAGPLGVVGGAQAGAAIGGGGGAVAGASGVVTNEDVGNAMKSLQNMTPEQQRQLNEQMMMWDALQRSQGK